MRKLALTMFAVIAFQNLTAQIEAYSSLNVGATRRGYTAGFGASNKLAYSLNEKNQLTAMFGFDFFIQTGPPLSNEDIPFLGIVGVRILPAIRLGYRVSPGNSNFYFDAESGAAFYQGNAVNRVRFCYDAGVGYFIGRNKKYGIEAKYNRLVSPDNFYWISFSAIFRLISFRKTSYNR